MYSFVFAVFAFCCFQMNASQDKSRVILGVDHLFTSEHVKQLKGKRIGLLTNHTAINKDIELTLELFKRQAEANQYTLKAVFAPEHGLNGMQYASEDVKDQFSPDGIPIYSLHGVNRRPNSEMLKGIDLIVCDLQDIGSRSYTYISTLFYVIEEAAKHKIAILVLDRPNPINGLVVEGPMMEEKWRSIVGYINIPYCHGMTIGELATYFNKEYEINASLSVVPMIYWKREMSFLDTGLSWIPTSPNIPEPTTPLYYPITGTLGELQFVNIGIGYTLPFKLVGAPWIDAQKFSHLLNSYRLPGVYFQPFYYRPFFGRYAHEECQGVLIMVFDPKIYKPIAIQSAIISALKQLYPNQFKEALQSNPSRLEMFHKVNGTEEVYRIISRQKFLIWPLRELHERERACFLEKRKKYLLY